MVSAASAVAVPARDKEVLNNLKKDQCLEKCSSCVQGGSVKLASLHR